MLAFGAVCLAAFRVGLNVSDSQVTNVGYAGVVGAERIVDGFALYGGHDIAHLNTYGPANYLAYVPFVLAFPLPGGVGFERGETVALGQPTEVEVGEQLTRHLVRRQVALEPVTVLAGLEA